MNDKEYTCSCLLMYGKQCKYPHLYESIGCCTYVVPVDNGELGIGNIISDYSKELTEVELQRVKEKLDEPRTTKRKRTARTKIKVGGEHKQSNC